MLEHARLYCWFCLICVTGVCVYCLDCLHCEYRMTDPLSTSVCALLPDQAEIVACDGVCFEEYVKIFGRPTLFLRGCETDDCTEEDSCHDFTGECRICCAEDFCNNSTKSAEDFS